ncbi:TonB-dependent receptor domain-containing protein [Asticcacaulis taihuensis]|uniref:TonB-dependent receptor domain-containing protein n=1 Tax=Asticcacaulis taihuensis TaxID=260084 RepID=UPI0026F2172F|nr:TonB-dependent receptor [Asticcacaulis taihuensis]
MSKSTNLTRKWLLAGTILTTLSIGLPAFAQDTTPPADTTTAPSADTTAAPGVAPADEPTEIVITGSRIRRSEFNAPSPVQIITAEKSSLSGMVSAAEVLQNSSIASGSGQINNTFTGYVVNGGDGINTVSLRGLGAQRSLVLLNGHRMPPAGVGGTVAAVDLNTIPDSVVSRYEILKDGASSIYGSDAVAGVVNIITRKNTDGIELSATTKVSEHTGGDSYEVTGLWGKTFDRGDIMVSLSGYELKELTAGDRDAFACPTNNYFNADGTRADLIDPNTGTYKCFGGATNGYVGTYFPQIYYDYYGFAGYYGSRSIQPGKTSPEGIDGWDFIPLQARDFNNKRLESQSIISPVKTLTLFSSGSYRPAWADGVELYGELLINQRKSEQHGWRTFFPRYNEDSEVNPFAPAFGGLGLMAEPYMAVPSDSKQDVKVFRVLGGARGEIGKWSWDAYLSMSRSDGKYTSDVIPNDRVEAGTATDQRDYHLINGGVACGADAPAGCVPLDVFNQAILEDGQFPQAMADYYFLSQTGKTTYDQDIFEATLTGDLFELPAGPLSSAFGVTIRQDKINDVPGEFSRNANAWGQLTAGITKGQDTVKEVYGEFEIPVVKGKPFFEDLTVDASGRYSDYDTVGSAWTYKLGLDWAVDNILRLRATSGTSFRAPGLFELYLNKQTSFLSQGQVDPCIGWGLKDQGGNYLNPNPTLRANCAADGIAPDYAGFGSSAEITTSGGLNLEPEESQAVSFGFVLTPPDTGFKFAMDFWRIKVANQILSTTSVVNQCYYSEYFRSRPGYCDLFVRDTDQSSADFGRIVSIDASYRNIPTEKTAGIDFTIDYSKEFNFGSLNVSSQITYTAYDKAQTFPGDTFDDYNGLIGDPKWVGDVQSRFTHKDWTYTWTVHYTQASSNIGFAGEDGTGTDAFGTPVHYRANVPDYFTHDFTVRYNAKSWEVIAGVVNLLDKTPPYVGAGLYSGSASRIGNYPFSSQYYSGYIGRQFYLRLSKSF